MEEYRSNSLKIRDGTVEPVAERKIDPVISGPAMAQKRSGLRKFKDSIIAEDMNSVGSWILSEVLIPSFKRAISDVVTNGIDMLLYGKASGPKSSSSISKVSYGNFYSRSYNEPLKAGSNGSAFDYDNIIFGNRGDAEAVLTEMENLLDQFEVVSVADLYELADVAAPNYTANKYGWTSLKGSQVLRCKDGYLIKLPRVTIIDRR